jgi:hypothetical protein
MIKIINKTTIILLALFLLISSPQIQASELTVENFVTLRTQIHSEYQALLDSAPKRQLKKIKRSVRDKKIRLSANQRKFKSKYFKLLAEKKQLDAIFKLKEDFIKLYNDQKKNSSDLVKIDREATEIAIGLFGEIPRLKKRFKSFFIPIVHNMFISVGVKKRGACKDWAEDLLTYLRTLDRKYFYVTWGEANPKKFTEHNVAVVYPATGDFHDGLIIDPWRTSGKPFWVHVKKDKHYKWNPWDYYGVY